jgi:hypothetical protein
MLLARILFFKDRLQRLLTALQKKDICQSSFLFKKSVAGANKLLFYILYTSLDANYEAW